MAHPVKTIVGGSVALGLSFLLTGCFELQNNTTFRANGEATVEVEIAVAADVMAMISNPAFAKAGKTEGFPNLLGECGKPWPKEEPIPDGVRSIESRRGKRGDMETCTVVFDVSDPIRAVESAKKVEVPNAELAPKQDISLVRLDSGSGYRFRISVTPAKSDGMPPEAAKMAAAMMSAMLADRHLTFTVSGRSVTNTNGELTPDGRKATWKIPLLAIANPDERKPLLIEADVTY